MLSMVHIPTFNLSTFSLVDSTTTLWASPNAFKLLIDLGLVQNFPK